ncbi:hypothetical protein FOH24_15905 [Acetobacter tropicalis]|uniref:Uncharacterized protein n=1 Tax=Acetobacter tropicalis TaxID=104102 RepID=A0A094YL98_9PROT|nr:hypothetical protein [Acetobacter tropicalis]KAA8385658.1 hypothetical protein FOH24_15905 [Acetobacter tropicalis]KAA8386737.1 hypothetical protein FOH22_10975 [Acetobacter tropicalis]KGB22785.1 hypothetical protein AtDm6_2020 [Acetobacter tropicalis]MBC9008200.1 hypothetical protein [Acetobacter tropicalis]MDO8170805.1 hypothetical protein [Acetobacter tropicalis]
MTDKPKPSIPPRGPLKKRSLRQHIVRRLALVLPITVLMIVLAKSGMIDTLTDRYTFRPESWFDDSALVRHLRVVVTHNGMSHDRPDCLLFVVNGNDPPNASRIDVMQKHSGTCPGPKGDLPKLFTLQVDRMNRIIQSDQGSPGTFLPLP